MKTILPYLSYNSDHIQESEIIKAIKTTGYKLKIDRINWPEYPYKPNISAFLANNARLIFIYFEVENDYLRANCKTDNEPVYEDSCVEFFVSNGNESYSNIECSCTGIILAARGENRHNRIRFSTAELKQIKRSTSVTEEQLINSEPQNWNLLLQIPLELLQISARQNIKVNLYKCGDKTEIPHYLSCFPINTPKPDFHRPEYFNEFVLSKSEKLKT